MGRDGVIGITRIAQAGGTTLAQDEASSAVFGMNAEAIKEGSVQHVCSPIKLAEEMCELSIHSNKNLV
jgi:two-component system chemotaxis response regulator CheB